MGSRYLLVCYKDEQKFRKYEATEAKEITTQFEMGWPQSIEPWDRIEVTMLWIKKDGNTVAMLPIEEVQAYRWAEET